MTMLVNLNIVCDQALAEVQHRAALVFANHRQRNGKDQAEDHNLQHGIVGYGLGDILGEGVQDGFFGAEFGNTARVARRDAGKLNSDLPASLG